MMRGNRKTRKFYILFSSLIVFALLGTFFNSLSCVGWDRTTVLMENPSIKLSNPTSSAIHAPIEIEGNTEMDTFAFNEFLEGSGVADEPYIISDLEIDGGTGVGINLTGVTRWVTIKNCVIFCERYYGQSRCVNIIGCGNISLINCTIYWASDYGIYMAVSDDCNIVNCSIYNCYENVFLGDCNNITITRNRISNSSISFPLLHLMGNFNGVNISDNILFDGLSTGILLELVTAELLRVNNNFLNNCAQGIALSCALKPTERIVMNQNQITFCTRGMDILSSSLTNIEITHNIIAYNDFGLYCAAKSYLIQWNYIWANGDGSLIDQIEGEIIPTVNAIGYESDYDCDGISDYLEVTEYGTNWLNSDTDGDGMSDGAELRNGMDPLYPGDQIIFSWQLILLMIALTVISAFLASLVTYLIVKTKLNKTKNSDRI